MRAREEETEEVMDLPSTSTAKNQPTVPVEIQKLVLEIIYNYPGIWTKDCEIEWGNLTEEVKTKSKTDVETNILKLVFKSAKAQMCDKLKELILDKRLELSSVESELQKWPLYSTFEYYRKILKRYEEGLWFQQKRMIDLENRSVMEDEETLGRIRVKHKNEIDRKTRTAILEILEEYPEVYGNIDTTINKDYQPIADELVFRTNVAVDLPVIKNIVKSTRELLIKNLKTNILNTKLNRDEVEETLSKWIYYPSFRYYRPWVKESEKLFWEMRGEADKEMEVDTPAVIEEVEHQREEEAMEVTETVETENVAIPESQEEKKSEEEEDLSFSFDPESADEDKPNLPSAIVIRYNPPKQTESIRFVQEYKSEIPESCTEARRAQNHGSQLLERSYPGIPNRKFGEPDNKKFGADESLTWPVQMVLEDPEDKNHWMTYFEGWNIAYKYSEEYLEETAWYTLKVGKMKKKFLKEMEKLDKDAVDEYRSRASGTITKSFIFDYEDVSYFHSKANEQYGFAPVLYISLTKKIRPPVFHFIPINILDKSVFQHCTKRMANKPFHSLRALKASRTTVTNPGGCEKPEKCVCDKRYDLVYDKNYVQYVQTDSSGLLNFSDVDPNQRALSIECSKECGCSSKCPRRQTQRGQKTPLIVFYEGKKGFGLRAGGRIRKGQFIGEYTGVIKKAGEGDDTSYEACLGGIDENLVICSKEYGNAMRFMSHSCDPSARFVVVHSRRQESDPLIPRLAIFALKDIDIAEEVTISYWKEDVIEEAIKKGTTIECLCRTEKCKKLIPV
uniref:SET domain-containing protein n=2 Tax=Caenorhabditis tropicalis TaxID=1561998 RepID=A0A1I7T1H2_9PELO